MGTRAAKTIPDKRQAPPHAPQAGEIVRKWPRSRGGVPAGFASSFSAALAPEPTGEAEIWVSTESVPADGVLPTWVKQGSISSFQICRQDRRSGDRAG